MRSFIIITRENEVFRTIQIGLNRKYRIERAETISAAMDMLHKRRADFIFLDLGLLPASTAGGPRMHLQPFWDHYPTLEIIVMAPPDRIREAVMAVKAGASNYLTYPIDPEEVKYVVDSVYESTISQSELDYLRDEFWQIESLDYVRTNSPAMRQVFEKIRSVAATRSTVLLLGETGTGKGVMAKLIHQHSNRREAPFISVHCGAIPETLLESDLFGHEKGAFTGAVRRKLGKFEIAKSGTLFLDEIATITSSTQIKLLQVLQDGTFQRVGGEETLEANVRIISASNRDLKTLCDEGHFRKDLYFRLNVFPIEIPPLRERVEDIPHFVEVILAKLNRFNGKNIHHVHPEVMDAFANYAWPGNIRELENLIERAYILEPSSILTPGSFPGEIFLMKSSAVRAPDRDTAMPTLADARQVAVEQFERRYLRDLLSRCRGKIRESAAAADISTRQLHKLMVRYGIHKEEFKSPPAG
jgi:DNA-binding NtrC family response regulator